MKTKRIISFLLAVICTIGVFPISLFATDTGAGTEGYIDVARAVETTVTASSNSWGWDPSKLLDDSLTTGWADIDTDANPVLTFSFDSWCNIGSIQLYPRSENGTTVIFFPKTLKFSASMDGVKWKTVKSVTDYTASGLEYQTFAFDTEATWVKYLKIEMSDRTKVGSTAHAFFMDAKIMGSVLDGEPPVDADKTDLAHESGTTVTASSYSYSWDPEYIIDDSLTTGWADKDTDENPVLTFSFGNYCDISSVKFYPRIENDKVIFFPRTLKFSVSADGKSWREVKSVTNYTPIGTGYQVFSFESTAKFAKFLKIEMSDRTYSGAYHAFFMDAKIMGEFSSSASLTESAVKLKSATAGSEHIYNPVSHLIDGNRDNMWSSDGTKQDYAIIELEEASNVSRLDIWRRKDADTYPNAFDIYLSADGSNWQKVYSFTKSGSVGTEVQSYSFSPVSGTKFVKIDVTSPLIDNQGETRAQFAEVKVYAMPLIESASSAAEKIKIAIPDTDDGTISVSGYSELFNVSIKSSSNEAVIGKDGRFNRPADDEAVIVTLTVEGLLTGDTADKEVTVEVTGKETNIVMKTAEAIDLIPLPEHNSNRITYPTVPDGLSISVESSSDESIVALDGTITRPSETTSVTLTFRVTGETGKSSVTRELMLPVYKYFTTPALTEAEINEAHENYESKSFGIFVHYVNGRVVHVSYQDGSVTKSIDEAANSFDVIGFAEDAYAFGAEYVVITCWHEDARTLFPSMTNKRWRDDRRAEVTTATKTYSDRDLIGELLDAFSSDELISRYGREVDLHLYTHTNDAHDWTEEDQKLVDWNDPEDPSTAGLSDAVWNDYINELYYELCERYGSKLKGLWFDGHMKNLDQNRLRETILSVNPAMILVANTGYTTGTANPIPGWTLCDYRSWESDQHRDLVSDMPVSRNQTDYPITNGWWANVKKTDNEPSISNPQSAENIYKYIVAMSSISTAGGMLSATGYYPTKAGDAYPDDHWLTGVKEKLTMLNGYITPVAESIRNTLVGRAFPTTELTKVSDETFFSTESRDGKHIYIHVLNAPSGRTLELGSAAGGSMIMQNAVILDRDGVETSVNVVKTASGYEITLPEGREWDELDTIFKLTRIPTVTVDDLSMKKGDTKPVDMTITPNYSALTASDFTYETSNDNVSVSDGVITADKKGETVVTVKYLGTTVGTFNVKVTIAEPAKNSAMEFNGFQVRINDYNGLRSVFSLDRTVANEGYELVEFGAIVSSKESAEKYGTTLNYDESTESVSVSNEKIIKVPVLKKNYETGEVEVTDKTLSTSTDEHTDFCIAIVDYTSDRYKSDIYAGAYEVWRNTATGEVTIFYTNTDSTRTGKFYYTNLYQVTLENYKYGIINSADGDGTAYSVLEGSAAVTFACGSDYSTDAVDMNGDAFGETFEFKNVPTVGSNGKLSGAVVSIFADTYKNGSGEYEFTAIYAPDATGSSHKVASLNWNYASQLVSSANGLPNPAISAAKLWNKIKYVVVDDGITEVGVYGFKGTNARIVILSESVNKLSGRTFADAGNDFGTVYTAHSASPKLGVIDLSNVSNVEFTQMFENAKGVRYIHLPDRATSSADKDLKGCSGLLALWCGDRERPEDGVIDLSGANISKLAPKDGNLQISCAKVDTLILPNSCTSISDGAISGIKTIYQYVNIAAIAEYCANNGITYTVKN